ncbi:C40 family peptidase [Bacillus sp. FJAT-47783]|uniref:C40 family peptidase n=1 Tax=Bacillus sp. FJAT-47783 TaxID=2922712 RepID=UPI001FAC685B|nr:C40 family peptidase [Bacillus sp. FJAT-47783]
MLKRCILSTASSFLGTPYQFNAKPYETDTFDCSSFTQYVYGQCGVYLPRNSRQQFQIGTFVPIDKISLCDLLFFTTKKRQNLHGIDRIGHVAIYLGEGKMIHTYPKGKKVKVSSFTENWRKLYIGAKRVIRQ